MWPCLNLPWLRSPVWFISASLASGCSPCVDKRQRHHLRLRWAWSARNSQVCGERMTPVARSSIISVDWQPRELAVCLFYWDHEQLFLSDPGLNFQGNLETLHWDRKAILESGIQLWNSVFKDMFVHFSPPPPNVRCFHRAKEGRGPVDNLTSLYLCPVLMPFFTANTSDCGRRLFFSIHNWNCQQPRCRVHDAELCVWRSTCCKLFIPLQRRLAPKVFLI